MREDWSTLKKLIWLRGSLAGGAAPILRTVKGALLHITDALAKPAHELVAVLKPVQDLHGYDAPWPAGGGKNKFNQEHFSDVTVYSNDYSGYKYSDVLMLKPNTQYTFAPNSSTAIASGLYYYLRVIQGDDPDAMSSSDTGVYPVYNGSVTDSPVSKQFTTGNTGAVRFGVPSGGVIADKVSAVMTYKWQLEEGGSATAWTPYANECQISGWTGCEIGRCVSLLNGITPDYLDGSCINATTGQRNTYTAIGSACNSFIDVSNYLGKQVYLNHRPTGISGGFAFYSDNNPDTYVSGIANNGVTTQGEWIITIPDNPSIKYMRFTANPNYLDKVILCLVETKTTLPINWQTEAGTIYGGSITLNEDGSVDLYSDWIKREIPTFTDISAEVNNRFMLRNWSNGGYDKSVGETNLLCDVATVKWANENYTIFGQDGSSSIYFRDDTVTTVSEFKAKYAGCYIAYESYRHTYSYHFDNIGQLVLFLGENNIWVDASDDLTLTYYADGNASDAEALGILLGGMYSPGGDVSDREALNILLGN